MCSTGVTITLADLDSVNDVPKAIELTIDQAVEFADALAAIIETS